MTFRPPVQTGAAAGGEPGSGPALRPVALQELRLQAEGRQWLIEQAIAGLATLTPVRGELRAVHHGTVLEVEGRVSAIVTLCCDRCLGHFNQPLQAQVRELIELQAPAGPEGLEGLQEQLDPLGRFDPEHWVFEQLSLQLPLVNRCGPECPGPASWGSEPKPLDPRWGALGALRDS
ncbi:MAG: YceD family protein [Cyanobium sp.]